MRDVLGPFEAAREYARALNQARKALDALVEIEEATRPGTKLDVQGRKEIHAIARRGVLAAQSLMSTSPGKDPGNIAPPVDSREPCVCRLTGGACAGASRPTALDAATETLPECLRPMTEEERAKLVPISDEAIAEALRKGAEARYAAMNPTITRKAEGVKTSESPPPAGPTGMKPGQRCGRLVGHSIDNPHACSDTDERAWRGQTDLRRCPYVEPPAGPVCARGCGAVSTDDALSMGWRDYFATGLPGSRAYCTEACRDAGRPLHPEVPR